MLDTIVMFVLSITFMILMISLAILAVFCVYFMIRKLREDLK